MVAVATDDVACVLVYHLAPLGVFVPVLPSRRGHDDEEPQLVACIHEGGVLRVVGGADDGHAGLTQAQGIAPLLGIGKGIAHVGKVLMAIAANELVVGLAVEPEAAVGGFTVASAPELCFADAHAHHAAVHTLAAIHHAKLDAVEIGIFGRPEVRTPERMLECKAFLCAYRLGLSQGLYQTAVGILDVGDEGNLLFANVSLFGCFHLDVDKHVGTLFGDVVVVKKHAAASHLVALYGVGDTEVRAANEPHVAVHAGMVGEVELRLLLARRVALVVGVVGADCHHALLASLHAQLRQVDDDRQVTTQVLCRYATIDVDLLFAHDGFEVEGDVLRRHVVWNGEVLPVPAYPLIVAAAADFRWLQSRRVRGAHHLPLRVIVGSGLSTLGIAEQETPALVEVVHYAATVGEGEQPGH